MIPKLLENILLNAQPFKYLSQSEKKLVFQFSDVINYAENEKILSQGKSCSGLYIILKGTVSVSVKLLGKGEIFLTYLTARELFGEINLLENKPCTATVIASEATTCFLFNKKAYDNLYVWSPAIRQCVDQAIIEIVLARQTKMITEIQQLTKHKSYRYVELGDVRQKKPAIKINKNSQKEIEINFIKLRSYLPIFNNFNDSELRHLLTESTSINLTKKAVFIGCQYKRPSSFFIISGSLKVGIITDHHLLKFTVLGPNHFFCSTIILGKETELFTYECCEDSSVIEITEEKINLMKLSNPNLAFKLINMRYQYFASLQGKINAQIIRLSSEKLISIDNRRRI